MAFLPRKPVKVFCTRGIRTHGHGIAPRPRGIGDFAKARPVFTVHKEMRTSRLARMQLSDETKL
jgi:hypothetical protein